MTIKSLFIFAIYFNFILCSCQTLLAQNAVDSIQIRKSTDSSSAFIRKINAFAQRMKDESAQLTSRTLWGSHDRMSILIYVAYNSALNKFREILTGSVFIIPLIQVYDRVRLFYLLNTNSIFDSWEEKTE